jgi:hypothetical protein
MEALMKATAAVRSAEQLGSLAPDPPPHVGRLGVAETRSDGSFACKIDTS